MTRHPPVALFVLGAAVLVVAGTWWLAHKPLLDDGAASAQATPPQGPVSPDTAPEIADPPSPSTVEPLPVLDHDDGGFSSQDLWAHISDPANSDLPPDLFAELSQLGADIVRADATGQSRDRWPDYWPTDNDQQAVRAEPCCTDITVHAAAAFTEPGHPGLVQATVIWTGLISQHEYLVEQVTHLRLQRTRAGWRPAMRYVRPLPTLGSTVADERLYRIETKL